MNVMAKRDKRTLDKTVNAVIIYDTFDFATKAKATLERAAHRTRESLHWNLTPWRVDMLKLPPAVEESLADAAAAHLFVLPVRQLRSLLEDWLERWATCRQVQEATLAVWDGGNTDTLSAQVTSKLSHFVGHHGVSLLFDDHALVGDKSSMFASVLHKREVSMNPDAPAHPGAVSECPL